MTLTCRIFGHDITGWVPRLYAEDTEEVRGCVRCDFREYRPAPAESATSS